MGFISEIRLWANRITKRSGTGEIPYELAVLLTSTNPHSQALATQQNSKQSSIEKTDDQVQLEERRIALQHSFEHSWNVKDSFDKKAKGKQLSLRDLVLLWEDKATKLATKKK